MDTRPAASLIRAVALSLAAVIAIGVASASPASADGYFKAKNLNDCIGYTESDLMQAPTGTEPPFGGVRLFREDDMRGRSITYCLTLDWDGGKCCAADALIILPRSMRRDAESLRLAAASGCPLDVDLRTWNGLLVRREIHAANEPHKVHRRIPEEDDDRAVKIEVFLPCWEGVG